MTFRFLLAASLLSAWCAALPGVVRSQPLRPPAVPLVLHDPYLSIWSFADGLADDETRHWTGSEHRLSSLVRIDGQTHRIMGREPSRTQSMQQLRLQVLPTRTIYEFEAAGIHLTFSFITPALPNDLDVLSRPVSYIQWVVRSTDETPHDVQLYFHASSQLAVNDETQAVTWDRQQRAGLEICRIGTVDQNILGVAADDRRIDWGYFYLAVPEQQAASVRLASSQNAHGAFRRNQGGGSLPQSEDTRKPRAVSDDQPVAAVSFDLGKVGRQPVSRHVMLAYDDLQSVEYFGERLLPYWRRNGMDAAGLLQTAAKEFDQLSQRCADFDRRLMQDSKRLWPSAPTRACVG